MSEINVHEQQNATQEAVLNAEDLTSALETSVNQTIRVYKGGPESRTGRLVAAKEGFIVMDCEQDGIIYYNTKHIKSMTETVPQNDYGDRPADFYDRYTRFNSLNEVLEDMKYRIIRVDREGPESRVGRLLGVGQDVFVLHTKEDGVLYYNLEHVKSISEEANNNAYELEEYPEILELTTFNDLLTSLIQRKWVKINRGGPESVEGYIVSNNGGYITLIVNKEIYNIATFHIRNVSIVADANPEANQEAENQQAQQAQQEKNQKKKK